MLMRLRYNPTPANGVLFSNLLPTYGLIGFDPITELATVDVPDEDLPAELLEEPDANIVQTHMGPVFAIATPKQHAAWHRHLDERYSEHAGRYRPEIA